MIKKMLVLLFALILSVTLFGCDDTGKEDVGNIPASSDNTLKSDNMTRENFASAPFFSTEEGTHLSDEDITDIIEKISSDKYEAYPNTHNVPVSATLYKDGKEISIDLDDERLIKLINFFNNCVYYSKCAYTQGLLPLESIEKVTDANFRMELKYTPYGEIAPGPYETCTTMCDTIVITNEFTLLAHDLPGYEGQGKRYPFHAVGFYPLYDTYNWLELFGF